MSSGHPGNENRPSNTRAAKNNEQISDTSNASDTDKSAKNSNNNTNSNTDKNPDSLINRIQNSATALIRDAVTRPSGSSLSTDLAHALNNNNGKPSSSSSYSAVSSNLLDSTTSRTSSSSSKSPLNNTADISTGQILDGTSSSFRSSTGRKAQGGFDLEPFEHDPSSFRDDFHAEQYAVTESQKGKGKGKEKLTEEENEETQILDWNIDEFDTMHFNEYEIAWINAARLGTIYGSLPSSQASTPPPPVSEETQDNALSAPQYNETDGAEVVNLLSDPSFTPGGLDDYYNDEDNIFTDNEGYPIADTSPLTAEELKIIDSFRRQSELETQNQAHSQPRITSQSLIPDIDTFLAGNNEAGIMTDNDTTHTALRDTVLTHLPGAEDWLDVHERYSDEVWGYLRPALEAAVAELEEQENKSGRPDSTTMGEEGPAVRRLKMILRHMQQGY